MTVTIELPDDELFKAALQYQTLDCGYYSIEDYCADSVVGSIEAEEHFKSHLAAICQQWRERYQAKANTK